MRKRFVSDGIAVFLMGGVLAWMAAGTGFSAPTRNADLRALGVAVSAYYSSDGLMNFQGVLRDASGQPRDGAHDMVFWFYDGDTGGQALLSDTHAGVDAVAVNAGLFNVALGSGLMADGPGPGFYDNLPNVFENNGEIWLETEVNGETLAPRVHVLSAPYAFQAGHATLADDSMMLGGLPASTYLTHNHDSRYLRKDVNDTAAGNITFSKSIGVGAVPTPGYSIRCYGQDTGGFFSGYVKGSFSYGASASTSSASVYGVHAKALHGYGGSGSVFGVFAEAQSSISGTGSHYGLSGQAVSTAIGGTHYGVYGEASGAPTNYGAYFQGGGGVMLQPFHSGNYGAFATAGASASAGHLTGLQAGGHASGNGNTVTVRGIHGQASGDSTSAGVHYGVLGEANAATSGGTHFGVYGAASGGATNWGLYTPNDAYVGGTLSSDSLVSRIAPLRVAPESGADPLEALDTPGFPASVQAAPPAALEGGPAPGSFVDLGRAAAFTFDALRRMKDKINVAHEEIGLRTPDPVTGTQELDGNMQVVLDKDALGGGRFSIFGKGMDGLAQELLRVDEDGNLFVKGALRPTALDLAEYHSVSEPVEPGDVLVMGPEGSEAFERCRKAGDRSVVGIVSEAPGVLMGSGLQRIAAMEPALAAGIEDARARGDRGAEDIAWKKLEKKFNASHAPLALSGSVPCKVDAGYGPIRKGDLLAASPTPGHAMRSDDSEPGTIVGKAMESLDSGTGIIRVLVMLR